MLTNQRLRECGYLKGARAESLLETELSCIETRVWLVLSTACVSVFTGTIAGLSHLSMGLINCNENSLSTESLAVHRNAKSRWGVRNWGVVSKNFRSLHATNWQGAPTHFKSCIPAWLHVYPARDVQRNLEYFSIFHGAPPIFSPPLGH